MLNESEIELYMAFSRASQFAIIVSVQVDVHQSVSGILQSSGNSSTSGDSTPRSCLFHHARMSSLSLYRHTFCYKCRVLDHHTYCSKCRVDDCDM